ncbi:MAG: DUF4091 domain-containing protein [Candidatus Lokiarchaeota archaeon]|nr:DUF4091 domain-containing protein [Candidatus Lokiarchaeota archaeon]
MQASTDSSTRRSSWAWIASASALVVLLLVFNNGNAVGNNFDGGRYYTILMVLPATVAMLACIVLQRLVNPRVLLVGCAAYEIVVVCWYSAIALDFQSWNGDALVYISSYMFVYHGGLYAAMLAGALPLSYLAFLELLPAFKRQREQGGTILQAMLRDAAWIVAIATGVLLLAKYYALGTSHLVLAAAIGVGIVRDLASARLAPPGIEETPPQGSSAQSSSKLKNVFLVLVAAFAALGLSYLWSINYMRVGDDYVAIYTVDEHDVVSDSLLGLVISEVVIALMLAIGSKRRPRIRSIVAEEGIYALSLVGLVAGEWLLVAAGARVLPVRAPLLLTPVAAALGASWLATVAATRRRESGGLLGAVWLLSGLTGWLGLCVSTDPDLDGIVLIISGVVVIVAVLSGLVAGVVNPRFVAGKQGRVGNVRRIVEWPHAEHPAMVALHKNRRAFGIIAIAALVAMPAVFTVTAAASPAQYQLLANVNNDCIFYLVDPMARIAPEYQPYFGMHGLAAPNPNITLSAAKGEYEPVHVVMKPINQAHFTVYSITFSNMTLASDPGVKILSSNWTAYTIEPVAPLSAVIQDVVVPFNRYTVSDGLNHPLWLLFHVPRTAQEGDYLGTITMVVDNKTQNPIDWHPGELLSVAFPVSLHVFNFTLPDSPTLMSNFGFSASDPAFPTVTGWFQERRMMHWSHLALPESTLGPTGGVVSVDTASLDAGVNAIHAYGTRTIGMSADSLWLGSFLPRPWFVVDGVNYTHNSVQDNSSLYRATPAWNATAREYMSMLESYLKSKTYLDWFGTNVSWHDEVYLTGNDEVDAHGAAALAEAIHVYSWVKDAVNASLPIMQTMGPNAELEAVVDIICFHTSGHEPENVRPFLAASPDHDVWIYTTCGPRFPHPTIATYGMATESRAIAWQCFIYGYSHYLIWDVATPWNAGNGYAYQGWNGGSLLYSVPGGYALSTRMEMIREGFEDYEYFTLLARSAPSAARDALLARVSGLMDGYVPTMDYRVAQALRLEIGEFLSA